MEQMKILNRDFGREHKERKTLVDETIRNIQEKVSLQGKEEFGSVMRGTRISILGTEQVKRKLREDGENGV